MGSPLVFAAILVVLLVAVWLVSAPLRAPAAREGEDAERAGERADLEAARDSTYAQIREAELDVRTGKLSREDFRGLDGRLRADAIEILRRLDELGGRTGRG